MSRRKSFPPTYPPFSATGLACLALKVERLKAPSREVRSAIEGLRVGAENYHKALVGTGGDSGGRKVAELRERIALVDTRIRWLLEQYDRGKFKAVAHGIWFWGAEVYGEKAGFLARLAVEPAQEAVAETFPTMAEMKQRLSMTSERARETVLDRPTKAEPKRPPRLSSSEAVQARCDMAFPKIVSEVRRQVHIWLQDEEASETFLGMVGYYPKSLNQNRVFKKLHRNIEAQLEAVSTLRDGGIAARSGAENYRKLKAVADEIGSILGDNGIVAEVFDLQCDDLREFPPRFEFQDIRLSRKDKSTFGALRRIGNPLYMLYELLPSEAFDALSPEVKTTVYYAELHAYAAIQDVLDHGRDFGYEAAHRLCSTYEVTRAVPLIREVCPRPYPEGLDEGDKVWSDTQFLKRLTTDLQTVKRLLEKKATRTSAASEGTAPKADAKQRSPLEELIYKRLADGKPRTAEWLRLHLKKPKGGRYSPSGVKKAIAKLLARGDIRNDGKRMGYYRPVPR